jgi:hypothetical protein
MNAVQEELVNVVEGAGLTLNKPDNTQLLTAINRLIKGGDYKDSVRVATDVAINLAAPGAVINGVAMVAGDRFLDKDNATLADRGIYIWNGAAVPATRALDADTGAELNGGAIIPVESGTVNADTNWQVTNDGVVTIGVTGLTFAQVGAQNFASNAEAQAFAVLNKSIAPATLAAALQGSNQLLSGNGYQKLPGNLIIQWATVPSSTTSITFPIAFPNSAMQVIFQANAGSGALTCADVQVLTKSATGFTRPGGVVVSGFYIAVGY